MSKTPSTVRRGSRRAGRPTATRSSSRHEPVHADAGGARLAAVACALGALAVYGRSLYPTVAGGDSGEFVVAAATLGVAHPSGYPLFTLLGHAYSWIPAGSVAWRVNLLSASAGAAAAGLLCLAVARWAGSIWAGVVAAGLFACSSGVWHYATHAEVFALHNLAVAALLLASLRYAERRDPASAAFVGLTTGLGLSNHHTLVFYAAVTGAVVLYDARRWSWRERIRLATAFGLGLTPYLYLLWAGHRVSPARWGDTGTWQGLVDHVLRRDYGTFRLAGELYTRSQGLWTQLSAYGANLVSEISWVGIIAAAVGVAAGGGLLTHGAGAAGRGWRRQAVVGSVVAWAGYLLVFHSLTNLPIDRPLFHGILARFWPQAHLLVCAWAGLGVAALAARPRLARWLGPAAAATAVLLPLGLRAAAEDRHQVYAVRDYGRALVAPVPPRALLLTRGDLITNSSRYVLAVDGARPDVAALDVEMLTRRWMAPLVTRLYPDLVLPGSHYHTTDPGAFTLRQLVEANISRRPIVVCGGLKDGDGSLAGAYDLWPLGLCDEVRPVTAPFDMNAWAARSAQALPPRPDATLLALPDWSWERVVWIDLWEARHKRPYWFLVRAIAHGSHEPWLAEAAAGFEALIAEHPLPPAHYYKNLGIAHQRLSATRPASRDRWVAAWREYLRRAPADDRDLPAIRAAVDAAVRPQSP